MLALLILGCATDLTPAVTACEAVPALYVPEGDRTVLPDVLVSSEVSAMSTAAKTAGGAAVDWSAVRAATTCTAEEQEDGTLLMTRTGPRIRDEGGLGETWTHSFTWGLDDGRVDTGLVAALAQMAAIPEDAILAEAAWEALVDAYPDPSLAVDLALARKEAVRARYLRDHVTMTPVLRGDSLVVDLANTGNRPLVDVTLVANLEGRPPHTFTRARLDQGTKQSMIEVTKGATGLLGVELQTWTLGEPTDVPPSP
jgi:hypothetical protein